MNSFILREQFFYDDVVCVIQRYISEERINIKTCHEEIGISDQNFTWELKRIFERVILCPFELLYREVSDFIKDSSDKELLKSKLKELSQSSQRRLKHNVLEENLSQKQLESSKSLTKSPDMIIQKSDKGNSVVILDKKFYLEKMNEMLDIKDQFIKLSIQEEKLQFFD